MVVFSNGKSPAGTLCGEGRGRVGGGVRQGVGAIGVLLGSIGQGLLHLALWAYFRQSGQTTGTDFEENSF